MAKKNLNNRIILAGMMGNLVETYDLAICGFSSVFLAKYLAGNNPHSIFLVLLTFFTAYLARPIGALFLGLFSDTYGRKKTLAASVLLMGIATALIGFIPPPSILGFLSIIFLLILRTLQCICCGAEYLNSSSFLIECAEKGNKGYSGSWASFGAMTGLLLASITMITVLPIISNNPDSEWILWRVPFVLALLGASMGIYIRLFIPESLEYMLYYSDNSKPNLSSILKQSLQYIYTNKIKVLYVFSLSSLGVTTTSMIYIFSPLLANYYNSFTLLEVIAADIISLFVMLFTFPFIGKLSDKVNRDKIILSATIGFLILSFPFFLTLSYGNLKLFILVQSLISIPAAAYYATVPVVISQMFPLRLRCTVLSVIYSIAASLSAGIMPICFIAIINKTNVVTSPAWIIWGLGFFSMLMLSIKKRKKEYFSHSGDSFFIAS